LKPALYAFSPYLRFKGGGEKYFLRVLEVIQDYFSLHLIIDHKDLHHLHQQLEIFGIDLNDISLVNCSIRSQADIQEIVPSDAIFFSVSNGRPLTIDCHLRILHQQVIFRQLTLSTASVRYPGHDKDALNAEIRNSFGGQDKIFFPSNFIRDFMIHQWGLEHSTSQVIHPPIADTFFNSVPRTTANNIVSIGRFEPIKQQKAQIELFNRIHRFLPENCRLVIVGSKRTELSDRFERMVDPNRIHIKYGLSESELYKEYASADVFWSTTGLNSTDPYQENNQESFGLAIAEAMAMGCVPVAVNAGGVSEIIRQGRDGYLVNSLDEMGYATIRLLFDRDIWQRLNTSALTRAGRFSNKVFCDQVERLFLN